MFRQLQYVCYFIKNIIYPINIVEIPRISFNAWEVATWAIIFFLSYLGLLSTFNTRQVPYFFIKLRSGNGCLYAHYDILIEEEEIVPNLITILFKLHWRRYMRCIYRYIYRCVWIWLKGFPLCNCCPLIIWICFRCHRVQFFVVSIPINKEIDNKF